MLLVDQILYVNIYSVEDQTLQIQALVQKINNQLFP